MAVDEARHHFLVVTYGVQSHINPGRALARRLARLGGVVDGSITATLSVPVSAYRRMFPSLDATAETTDAVISYVSHSDGFDDGSTPTGVEAWARWRRASADSLSAVVARLAGLGRPVTCVVCTMALLPALDVAREHSIPVAVYWLQTATAFAATYHFFHGLGELVAAHAMDAAHEVHVPGLSRPLRIGCFPTFLTDASGSDGLVDDLRELFQFMDRRRPVVLVNTFHELEPSALAEMERHLDVVAVGPMAGDAARIHLFEHDEERPYMEWLQARPDSSVVYVSFGSMTKVTKRQMAEIAGGLRQCGRPYLMVVRRDGVECGDGDGDGDDGDGDGSHGVKNDDRQGMVVGWCDQLEVLSHAAVGCFVSHCGWNSVTEAMVAGVPIVGVPSVFDQPTNMYLVEEELGTGVRGERNGDGVLTGTELARCIELVMGDGARAVAIRERAKALKDAALAAANAGESAESSLRGLVETMSKSM